jgi:hypothetical protein
LEVFQPDFLVITALLSSMTCRPKFDMTKHKRDVEVHGTPKPGHKHDFQYESHSLFECQSKCKCGAVHHRYYSPDGYIGDSPSERIFEKDAKCYFSIECYDKSKGYTGESDCKDIANK